jgi:hypothetical protein
MATSDDKPAELRNPASARRWSRRAFLGGCVGGAGLALAGGYGAFVEAHWLQVERVPIPLTRLPAAFHGFTIAQLSDVHFGKLVDPAHIRRAVDVTLDLAPDLIVLTGDYVSDMTDKEPKLITSELGRLSAPAGVWAVLGNHDHNLGARIVTQALTRANVRVLRNANGVVRRAGEQLWLAGVDDVCRRKHDLSGAMQGIPEDAPVIALVHEPDFADEVALEPRVRLQLSGHSHGGQVCCPLLGPLRLPLLGRKYPQGLYQIGGLWLYTNRGLGTMGVPIRFHCRPEITLFTLTATGTDGGQA